MEKHAYLILCHKCDDTLQYLLKSIDDKRNDIYLHVDRKAKKFDFDKIKSSVVESKVYFTQRINVSWGGFSITEAELILLESALKNQTYEYYHFLSGNDMCIKSQDYIHKFFNENKGKIFLTFCGNDWNRNAESRVKYFYLEQGRSHVLKVINKILVKTQKLVRVNRLKNLDYCIVGGSNWCSIPNDFAEYLINNKDKIYHIFKYTFCSDELFFHTMAYNSLYKERIYLLKISEFNNDKDLDMFKANQRYIDWNRGRPYTFCESDFNDLINSEYCFSRKFIYTDSNKLMKQILIRINEAEY